MNKNDTEKAKELLKKQREAALKASAAVSKKVRNVKYNIKDVNKDFDPNKDYYVALLNIVPMIGAEHWFSAAEDRKEDGTKFNVPRNCCANLLPDNSFGNNPDLCPACYRYVYEKEYYQENKELPENIIPVDIYDNAPKNNGATVLIYYYALVGEPREIEQIDASGNSKIVKKIYWWVDEETNDYMPVVLKIKPSINNIFTEYLNKIEVYDGDIRAYVWKIHKKSTNDFKKYENTGPVINNSVIMKVPDWVVERRDEFISKLPTAEELLKPVSAEEMAELLEMDWPIRKIADKKIKNDDSAVIDVSDETSDSEILDVGSDTIMEDANIDLEDLDIVE